MVFFVLLPMLLLAGFATIPHCKTRAPILCTRLSWTPYLVYTRCPIVHDVHDVLGITICTAHRYLLFFTCLCNPQPNWQVDPMIRVSRHNIGRYIQFSR